MFNVVKSFHFENESKQMQNTSGSKDLNKLKCYKLSLKKNYCLLSSVSNALANIYIMSTKSINISINLRNYYNQCLLRQFGYWNINFRKLVYSSDANKHDSTHHTCIVVWLYTTSSNIYFYAQEIPDTKILIYHYKLISILISLDNVCYFYHSK